MKRVLGAAALVVGSVILATLLVEAALHVVGMEHRYINPMHSFHVNDPVLGYRGRPNADAHFTVPGQFDVRVKHDAQGFRLHEYPKNGPTLSCAQPVIIYGDSFTWGWGVNQGEVFTDLVARDHSGEYCVYNRGVNASGTAYQLASFEQEFGQTIQPGSKVIVMFCFNDFKDNYDQKSEVSVVIQNGEVVRVPPREAFQSSVRGFLKRNSYLYSMGSTLVGSLRERFKDRDRPRAKRPILADDAPEMIVTDHVLAEFKNLCDQRGVEFLVALVPNSIEYGEPDYGIDSEAAASYRAHLTRILEAHQIRFIDVLAFFQQEKTKHPDVLLAIPGDGHWNAAGHAVAARALDFYLRPTVGGGTDSARDDNHVVLNQRLHDEVRAEQRDQHGGHDGQH